MNNTFARMLRNKCFGFDLYVCNCCNLRCRACSRFCNIAKPKFISIDTFKKELEDLKFTKIPLIYLTVTGGEPLLHPDILELLIIVREMFPNIYVSLFTNGLLFVKQDSNFYKTLNKYDIHVLYTKYSLSNIDYNKLVDICKEYNIVCDNIADIEGNIYKDKNVFVTNRLTKDSSKPNILKKYICKCDCACIWEGKIFQCCIPPFIESLNSKYNVDFEVTDKDYLLLLDHPTFEDLKKYYLNPIPFCKYCYNVKNDFIDWEVNNAVKEDWII